MRQMAFGCIMFALVVFNNKRSIIKSNFGKCLYHGADRTYIWSGSCCDTLLKEN